jgi:hypothetical protein
MLVCSHEVRALLPSRSRASTVKPVFDSTTGCLAICSQIGSGLISHPDEPVELELAAAGLALELDCVPHAEKTPAAASERIAPIAHDLGAREKTDKCDRIWDPPFKDVRKVAISRSVRKPSAWITKQIVKSAAAP